MKGDDVVSFTTNNSLNKYTLITQSHTDANGNNICEQIENELKQVVDREVLLEQIPHPHLGVQIIFPEVNVVNGTTNNIVLKEIDKNEIISNKNEMKIDYVTGKVTVHYSLEGKYVLCNYWGKGHSLIHSSRVYTKLDEYGSIVQTLEDLIITIMNLGNTDYIVEVLKDITDAKTSIINGTDYDSVKARLEDIELKIKGYLNDHVALSNKVTGMDSSIANVENIANDVDYRMSVFENNYMNPNVVSNADIDVILGGLV